jgi:hypothetical protein
VWLNVACVGQLPGADSLNETFTNHDFKKVLARDHQIESGIAGA